MRALRKRPRIARIGRPSVPRADPPRRTSDDHSPRDDALSPQPRACRRYRARGRPYGARRRDLRTTRTVRAHGRRRRGADQRPEDGDRERRHPAGREDPRDHGVGGGVLPDRGARRVLRHPPDASGAPHRWRRAAGALRRIQLGRRAGRGRRAARHPLRVRDRRELTMRVMTVFGTRPEIIRLSAIIRVIDRYAEHVLVHTGQNYDENLSDVFFRELDVRAPDHHLRVRAAGFADQAGQILAGTDRLMADLKPDRVVILGDTNSGLAAIAAARRGIPVYHLEAGNRCFDDRVPEELNRRLIDHCSTVLMPYTERSKDNLLREGIERDRIFVIGNPIFEVLDRFDGEIRASRIHEALNVNASKYFLATVHRAENVDDPHRLGRLVDALELLAERKSLPVIVSVHPRTADRLASSGIGPESPYVRLIEPLGFFDFVSL